MIGGWNCKHITPLSASATSMLQLLTPLCRLQSNWSGRANRYQKSGDMIIHQIRFLLGEVEDQAAPPSDTSAYEIAFGTAPPQGLRDLTVLDAGKLLPPVSGIDVPLRPPPGGGVCGL